MGADNLLYTDEISQSLHPTPDLRQNFLFSYIPGNEAYKLEKYKQTGKQTTTAKEKNHHSEV